MKERMNLKQGEEGKIKYQGRNGKLTDRLIEFHQGKKHRASPIVVDKAFDGKSLLRVVQPSDNRFSMPDYSPKRQKILPIVH